MGCTLVLGAIARITSTTLFGNAVATTPRKSSCNQLRNCYKPTNACRMALSLRMQDHTLTRTSIMKNVNGHFGGAKSGRGRSRGGDQPLGGEINHVCLSGSLPIP